MCRPRRRRTDRGASAAEYGGLLVLLGGIVAMLVTVGIPGKITTEVKSAVCTIFDQSGCKEGQQPPQPGGQQSPQAGGQTPVTTDSSPASTEQSPSPDELDGFVKDIEDAEQEADQAEKDAAKADKEAKDAKNEAGDPVDIAKELSGLGDVERCLTKADVGSCVWTAVSAIPIVGCIASAAKGAAKSAKKAAKLKKIADKIKAAEKRAADAREKARQAKERARKTREKLPKCAVKKKKQSFLPGTPVLLAGGRHKRIEDVDIGDRVWATDPVTGRSAARPVTDLISGRSLKHLVRVTVDFGSAGGHRTADITSTNEHPFWVAGAGDWVSAEDLVTGHRLTTADGRRATVVSTREYTRVQQVYNFTVADLHTYYVTVGGLSLLVHNSPGGPTSTITAPDAQCDPDRMVDSGQNVDQNKTALKKFGGDGFSGVYDPDTGTFQARLSSGPNALVPRRGGGHSLINNAVFGGSKKTVGFAVIKKDDKTLEVRWNSLSVNQRNFRTLAAPMEHRDKIKKAIEEATEMEVVG